MTSDDCQSVAFSFFCSQKAFMLPKFNSGKKIQMIKKKTHSAHASDTKPLNLATLRLYKN